MIGPYYLHSGKLTFRGHGKADSTDCLDSLWMSEALMRSENCNILIADSQQFVCSPGAKH